MAVLTVSLEQDNCHQTILSGEISLLLFRSNRAQDLYAIIMNANWCVGCNLCQTMVFFPLAVCDNQKPFSNTVRTYVFSSFLCYLIHSSTLQLTTKVNEMEEKKINLIVTLKRILSYTHHYQSKIVSLTCWKKRIILTAKKNVYFITIFCIGRHNF